MRMQASAIEGSLTSFQSVLMRRVLARARAPKSRPKMQKAYLKCKQARSLLVSSEDLCCFRPCCSSLCWYCILFESVG